MPVFQGVFGIARCEVGARWAFICATRSPWTTGGACNWGCAATTPPSGALNRLTAKRVDNPTTATTGSAALRGEVQPGLLPYVSYATSFYPNGGTDVGGNTFQSEQGKQLEEGLKFDLDGGRSSMALAAFELQRRNVLETDSFNTGFSIAVGEERTRGVELGFAADLRNGLSLMGGYAYTAAVVTEDGGQKSSTVGQWLNILTVGYRY